MYFGPKQNNWVWSIISITSRRKCLLWTNCSLHAHASITNTLLFMMFYCIQEDIHLEIFKNNVWIVHQHLALKVASHSQTMKWLSLHVLRKNLIQCMIQCIIIKTEMQRTFFFYIPLVFLTLPIYLINDIKIYIRIC